MIENTTPVLKHADPKIEIQRLIPHQSNIEKLRKQRAIIYMKILKTIYKQHKICPGSFLKNQTIESAYIHMAVITPTAIVIISTLMLMVLKRIRL